MRGSTLIKVYSSIHFKVVPTKFIPFPEDMVRTFTQEEPSSFETLGSQFSGLGDVPNWDSGQAQSASFIGLWLYLKSEFSGTESPDRDPRESQICLLGYYG